MTDKDLKQLYNDEINGSAPDMDALWERIENGLAEKESKNVENSVATKKRHFITLKRCLAFAAVCAVIAVIIPTAVGNSSIMDSMDMDSVDMDSVDEIHYDEAYEEYDNADEAFSDEFLSYANLNFPQSYSGIIASGEPNGSEYFYENDVLIETEGFIDGIVNSVYAGDDCVYYELSAVDVYGDIDSGTVTVLSRSKYPMMVNREYLIPVKSTNGELETVFDRVPQIEFTSDGGIVYYNGWETLDNDDSQSILYPKSGVDDFFYDRMKFSYNRDFSKLIERWVSIQGG